MNALGYDLLYGVKYVGLMDASYDPSFHNATTEATPLGTQSCSIQRVIRHRQQDFQQIQTIKQ